jgi:NAD(P)-dependent dehydrogenase (short-subunit alcohol dehydrogenase family)
VSAGARTALITGSSSGFGLHIAVELARAGHRVAATMRDPARAERLMEACREAGVEVRVYRLDVVDAAQVHEAVTRVEAELGPVDVVVNNAGFALAGFAIDLSTDDYRRQLETNLFGAMELTARVAPGMCARGWGRIVNMSSIGGLAVGPFLAAYSVSKWALEAYSEALRLELQRFGVWTSVLEPGRYATDIWNRNSEVAGLDRPGSPFAALNREIATRMRDRRQDTSRMADPAEIGRRVVAIVAQRRPRFRHLLGRDARLVSLLRRNLPFWLWERLAIARSRLRFLREGIRP